jgi:hypothetical protein
VLPSPVVGFKTLKLGIMSHVFYHYAARVSVGIQTLLRILSRVFYHCVTEANGGIQTLHLRILSSVLPLCYQVQWWDSNPLNLGL